MRHWSNPTSYLLRNPRKPVEEYILYHGTDERFRSFNPFMSFIPGGVWFSPIYQEVFEGHEVGIDPPRYIYKVRIRPKKIFQAPVDFDVTAENLAFLSALGHDAIYWPAMGRELSHWVVLDPSIIKILKVEEVDRS